MFQNLHDLTSLNTLMLKPRRTIRRRMHATKTTAKFSSPSPLKITGSLFSKLTTWFSTEAASLLQHLQPSRTSQKGKTLP